MALASAALAVLGFIAFVAAAHVLLPAYHTTGYACGWDGALLPYRLNGPLVLGLTAAAWALLLAVHGPDGGASFAAHQLWSCWGAANAAGLLAAACLFAFSTPEQPFRCLTADQKELRERAAKGEDVRPLVARAPARNGGARFFFGLEFNPRLGTLDLKMLCYTVGACGLLWNLLSAAAVRLSVHGSLSLAFCTYGALLNWFIVEYMCLEVMHLYTYDIFAERLGFKIALPRLVPFYYCSGVWPVAFAPPETDITPPVAAAIALLYGCGWVVTRGANAQKYLHKTRADDPRARETWLGRKLLPMRTVPGTRLLCGGFWGLSRHVNYLGEILQAVALALPGSLVAQSGLEAALPWAYPLYYLAILIPRQVDDDEQMLQKYGAATFGAYTKAVPYRIVPGVW